MADEAIKAEEKKPEHKPEDTGWHLPGSVRDFIKRILPVVVLAIAGAGVGMFIDNFRTKDAVSYESFRNNQQDEQITHILTNQKRLEARQDRAEERAADKQREDQEFQGEVLERLRKLLMGKR